MTSRHNTGIHPGGVTLALVPVEMEFTTIMVIMIEIIGTLLEVLMSLPEMFIYPIIQWVLHLIGDL